MIESVRKRLARFIYGNIGRTSVIALIATAKFPSLRERNTLSCLKFLYHINNWHYKVHLAKSIF